MNDVFFSQSFYQIKGPMHGIVNIQFDEIYVDNLAVFTNRLYMDHCFDTLFRQSERGGSSRSTNIAQYHIHYNSFGFWLSILDPHFGL